MIPAWLPDFTIAYVVFSIVWVGRMYNRGFADGKASGEFDFEGFHTKWHENCEKVSGVCVHSIR